MGLLPIRTAKLKSMRIIILFLLFIGLSCKNENIHPILKHSSKKAVSITIQPFSDLPQEQLDYVVKKLSKVFTDIVIFHKIELPSEAYYKPRNRFKADPIIEWLKSEAPSKNIIGITSKDISTPKGTNPDSGIMGLGEVNGYSCVVSSYRLRKNNKNEELFIVSLHELGHIFGLDHCPIQGCIMEDAKGRNVLSTEKQFCPSCKKFLIDRGWRL